MAGQITTANQDQAALGKEDTTIASEKISNQIKEPVIKLEGKNSMINGEHQNNNIQDSKSVSVDSKDLPVVVKKEKKPTFEEDDPFAALDWKDGIATLPGDYTENNTW